MGPGVSSMECLSCQAYVTSVGSRQHFLRHAGLAPAAWLCSLCGFRSAGLEDALGHAFLAGHGADCLARATAHEGFGVTAERPKNKRKRVRAKVGNVQAVGHFDSSEVDMSEMTARMGSSREECEVGQVHDSSPEADISLGYSALDCDEEATQTATNESEEKELPLVKDIEYDSNETKCSDDEKKPAKKYVNMVCKHCDATLNPKRLEARNVAVKHVCSCFAIKPFACSVCLARFTQTGQVPLHRERRVGAQCAEATVVVANRGEDEERVRAALREAFPDWDFHWRGFRPDQGRRYGWIRHCNCSETRNLQSDISQPSTEKQQTNMACSQCLQYLSVVGTADHYRQHQVGQSLGHWRCPPCGYQSPSFAHSLAHCLLSGHAIAALGRTEEAFGVPRQATAEDATADKGQREALALHSLSDNELEQDETNVDSPLESDTLFPEQAEPEEDCNKKLKRSYKSPKAVAKFVMVCEKCKLELKPRRSAAKAIAVKHVSRCCGIKPYACSKCGLLFTQTSGASSHFKHNTHCCDAKAVFANKNEDERGINDALSKCFPDKEFQWEGL